MRNSCVLFLRHLVHFFYTPVSAGMEPKYQSSPACSSGYNNALECKYISLSQRWAYASICKKEPNQSIHRELVDEKNKDFVTAAKPCSK